MHITATATVAATATATASSTADRTGAVGRQPAGSDARPNSPTGMAGMAECSVRATAVAVCGLRSFARRTAARWGVAADDTGLALVVSELVGNAVRHSGSADVSVLLSASASTLTVEVRDSGRWRPSQARPAAEDDDLACGGRGLRIVEACATRVTVHRTLAGTRVIADLPLA
ncbi:ATP-binding protein [Kitasatospora sp. NPDC048365]|uniref:ATP-binding protein n=1 Tax=Kitasatospora sp. NPDC048365 TaxID=3364050 RepID=UPI00371FA59B